jgi:hypothetical protein
MYSLAQILKPDFSRSWQEAVALVQEVAVASAGLPTLPAPEDLFLEEDATVAIGFASEEARDPVTSLAALLLEALEGTNAPPPLRSLAADNAKTPPAHATVAGFTSALAFYERPDRQSDLRAIVTRLSARRAAIDAEQELERLRRRIASSDDEEGADAQRDDKTHIANAFKLPRFSVRALATAAGILVALLGTVAGAGLARSRSVRTVEAVKEEPAPPSASVAAPAASAPRQMPKPEKQVSAQHLRAPSPGRQAAVAQKLPPPVQKRATQRAVTPSVSRPVLRAPAAATVQDRPAPIPLLPSLPVAPLLSSVRSAPPAATRGVKPVPAATDSTRVPSSAVAVEPIAGHVYSAAEPNVKPARLTRSQLPQQPSPNAETGYFDIVVDERGDVEFVKLLSPMRRYQDRMLVAAAKAWKFKPALLNGTPVKYRLLIPIILPEIPR